MKRINLLVSATIALALACTPALAESAECWSVFPGGNEADFYKIEAHKAGTPTVLYGYGLNDTNLLPAQVLQHWYSGLQGSDALGASFITLRLQDTPGHYLYPSLVLMDWAGDEMATAYVPFVVMDQQHLLVSKATFQCRRLD